MGVARGLYGEPPVWGRCERFVGDTGRIPTAQCGTVSVPVDYAKPQGAQAQLAVIRVPATGERIGVADGQPRRARRVGGRHRRRHGARRSADTEIRRRFDLVGFDPRGVGHSTPELRCRTDAEFDAYRREPMVDYSPAGVAHIEQLYRELRPALRRPDGPGIPGQHRHRLRRRATWTWSARRSAKSRSTTSASRYGTELGAAYAERFARPRAGHGARRRRRPEPSDPIDRDRPSDGGRSRRRSTSTPRTAPSRRAARWAPTRRSSSTATTSWSTRWCSDPARRPIRAG